MGFNDACSGGGKLSKLANRAHGPFNEISPAIRTYPAAQAMGDAIGAKRTLERADHRVSGIRCEILIAALAVGSER